MSFGDRLKALRESRGMTQVQLAEKLGTTKQAISRYENSQREPNIRTAKCIADALAVPLSSLANADADGKPAPTLPGNVGTELPISANKIILLGRDGRRVEKTLTDAELDAYKALIDLLPDATDDL